MNALATLFLPLLPACLPQETADERPWFAEVIFEAPAKLGGCAVGDLDPAHAGNEIAAVSIDGTIYLAHREGERWVTESIARASGELIQCAVGDADPNRPGHELLAVGMSKGTEDDGGPGAAFLVSKVDGSWKLEQVCEDGALLHAGTIADVDPETEGPEVVVAGFTNSLQIWSKRESGWTALHRASLTGPAKSLVPFRAGAAVACADGSLAWIHRAKGGDFELHPLDRVAAGQSRLGAAGDTVIVARDDGKLALVGADGTRTEIYSEGQKLRGAVLAELDPETPGLEAATAGYEMRMSVLYRIQGGEGGEGGWRAQAVYTDDRRFHHLAVGELVAESPGLEIVGCGYSGRIIVAGVKPR